MKRQSLELPVHQLFEAQAEASPHALAAVFKQEELSYGGLNRRANQLARYLRRLGVGPEVIVGLHSERSLEMLIALLAVLKTGGAFLPLNREYSPERLSQILKETQAAILITREPLSWRPTDSELRVITLDVERESIAREGDDDLGNLTETDNLAYVIYTSGTTGTPKGVMITHRGLTNHSLDIARQYALRYDDRVLQFAALSFDVAAEEIFPALLSGAAIILRTDEMLSSRGGIGSAAEEMGVTVLNLPASYWREWVDQLSFGDDRVPSSLRLLVVGSEKVSGTTYAAWRRIAGDRIRCINAYGLTETTITSTIYEPGPYAAAQVTDQDCLPIGRPIANTHLYVLDDRLQPVAAGTTAGELYIGGAGLARGYLALAGLTAEKFIPNPFSAEPGARLYKTGDGARFLPDGNLEFLGRLDRQVKVRGFRVELREVESVIAQHPAVTRVVVTSHDDSSSNTRLIAYVVQTTSGLISDRDQQTPEVFPFPLPPADAEPSSYTNKPLLDNQARQVVPELIRFAKAHLPAYMVPSTFVLLDKLPLTTNGKIDYRALPVPESVRPETAGLPPRTRTERLLATTWEEVLDVEQVGFNDNFFDCGGHSLRALRVLSRVRQSFKIELSLTDVFNTPTLAGLATLIECRQLELMGDDEVKRLLAELEHLSEDETKELLLAENEEIISGGPGGERFPSLSPAKFRLLILRCGNRLSAQRDSVSLTSRKPPLKRIARDGSPLPLSFAQEALWALDQSTTAPPHNLPVAWRLEGPLDSTALKRALDEVVNRHEVLRMRFVSRGGQVVQVPDTVASLQLAYADLRDLPLEERRARLEQAREAELREAFDPEHGPVIRGRLLRLDNEEYVLLLTLHHLVSDAASVGVLKAEAAMLYQAFVNGQPSPLAELSVQYADYAAWQREWLQGNALEEQLSYWREHLGETPPVLEFPADRALTTNERYLGANHRYPVAEQPMTLEANLIEALNALSRRENVTLYMTLLAAFKALLFRYTQQPAIIVGTPISGRTQKETESLIGLFVNNLAIRSDLSADQTFGELLGRVRQATLGAFAHQDLPYEKLIDELKLAPGRSHIPLFQAMFILQNARPAALRASKGINLKLSSMYSMSELTRHDLSVTVVEMPGDYNGWIQYRSDLFDPATIVQVRDNYCALLADVATTPMRRIGELLPSL